MLRRYLLQLLKQHLFVVLGLVFGLVTCTLLMAWMRGLEVHALFIEHAPDRVYVSVDCAHCQKALAALAAYPGESGIVIIPVDSAQTPARERLCEDAIRAVRGEGGLRLGLLPEPVLCQRLVWEARAWLEDQNSGDSAEVPTWVIGGQQLAPGWSAENVDFLKDAGILSPALEAP